MGPGAGLSDVMSRDRNQAPKYTLRDPFTRSSNTGKSALLSQNLTSWFSWEGAEGCGPWQGLAGVLPMHLYKLIELTLQVSVRYSGLHPR